MQSSSHDHLEPLVDLPEVSSSDEQPNDIERPLRQSAVDDELGLVPFDRLPEFNTEFNTGESRLMLE